MIRSNTEIYSSTGKEEAALAIPVEKVCPLPRIGEKPPPRRAL